MTFSGVDRRWSKKQAALMKSNRENFQRVGRHARELKGADATRSWQPRRNYAFRYSRRAWFGTHGIATVETRREKTDGERERERIGRRRRKNEVVVVREMALNIGTHPRNRQKHWRLHRRRHVSARLASRREFVG
mgnify:CR=1 FL=1